MVNWIGYAPPRAGLALTQNYSRSVKILEAEWERVLPGLQNWIALLLSVQL
jgi:hypothetical protein